MGVGILGWPNRPLACGCSVLGSSRSATRTSANSACPLSPFGHALRVVQTTGEIGGQNSLVLRQIVLTLFFHWNDQRMPPEQDPNDLWHTYSTDPDWLEKQYGLVPLRDMLDDHQVMGLTRLVVLDSFDPERIITCEFRHGEVTINLVEGETSLWWSFPRPVKFIDVDGSPKSYSWTPFDVEYAIRKEVTVPVRLAPAPFHAWEAVRTAAANAPSCCQEGVLDGVGYRHRLCSRDCEIYAEWANPDEKDNATQVELLRQYRRLAESGRIRVPFLPARRKWWLF